MNGESKILNSISSAMLTLASLVVLASLVGASLASLRALQYSFLALLILHAIRPLRMLGVVAVVGCIGIISWEWALALYRAFITSTSAFHSAYLIILGLSFSVLLLGIFAYSLIFSLGWCLPKHLGVNKNKPVEKNEGATFEKSQPLEQEESTSFNPFEILEVDRTASKDEIHSAYKKQMQLYHPDLVNHLGPELQRTAHQHSLLIQRAFEELVPN